MLIRSTWRRKRPKFGLTTNSAIRWAALRRNRVCDGSASRNGKLTSSAIQHKVAGLPRPGCSRLVRELR